MPKPNFYRITYLRSNGHRVARDFDDVENAKYILSFLLDFPRETRPTLTPVYGEL